MSETELFGKLSRIFETHGFLKNDFDEDLEAMLLEAESFDDRFDVGFGVSHSPREMRLK